MGASISACQANSYRLGLPPMQYSTEQFKAWGIKGAKARNRKLSKARRREIARKAAHARWHKPNVG